MTMQNWPKFILILTLLWWPLTACQTAARQTESTPEAAAGSTANEPLSVSTILDDVFAEGRLEPLTYAHLSFHSGGRVADILVQAGQDVQAGQALIRLEAGDQEIAYEQAVAQMETAVAALTAAQSRQAFVAASVETAVAQVTIAQAQLDLVKSGPTEAELNVAQSQVAAAAAGVVQADGSRDAALNIGTEAQIQAAVAAVAAATAERQAIETNYTDILDACYQLPDGSEVCPLYGSVEEITRAQLEAARLAEVAAQAALEQLQAGPTAAQQQAAGGAVALAVANQGVAQAQLDLLRAGATPAQIAQAEVGVQQAQVGVELAQAELAQAETAVAQAEVGVTAAQVAVTAAQLALDRLTLTAPFAGRITGIEANLGELVTASQPVLTLADMGGWQVKTTDLTELDVALIVEGTAVEVTLDAIPQATLTGTVTHVSLTPGQYQGDVVYETTIRLEAAPDLPLRWGMTAFVTVQATR